MAADRQAVVAGEDDQGPLVLAARAQRVEDPADLGVEKFDGRIIVGEVLADDRGRTRPGGKFFVAEDDRAVVEGVLGRKFPGRGGWWALYWSWYALGRDAGDRGEG